MQEKKLLSQIKREKKENIASKRNKMLFIFRFLEFLKTIFIGTIFNFAKLGFYDVYLYDDLP